MILVGERLATVPGALTAAVGLARRTGARLAWVPRRAGDRGAVETGLLPALLPGGRLVSDAAARVDLTTAWGLTTPIPDDLGLSSDEMLEAAAAGELADTLVVGETGSLYCAMGSAGVVTDRGPLIAKSASLTSKK